MRGLKVRHADRPRSPLAQERLKCEPGLDEAAARGYRPVDEIEVDVVQPEVVEAGLEGTAGAAAAVVCIPKLGSDEQLVAREPRRGERGSDTPFVSVFARGVDAAVAKLESGADGGDGVGIAHARHAEAETGHSNAVVECRYGDCGIIVEHVQICENDLARLSVFYQIARLTAGTINTRSATDPRSTIVFDNTIRSDGGTPPICATTSRTATSPIRATGRTTVVIGGSNTSAHSAGRT